jgi:hypothetical protein
LKALEGRREGLGAGEVEGGVCVRRRLEAQLSLRAVGYVVDAREVIELSCFVLKGEFSEGEVLAMLEGGSDAVIISGSSGEVTIEGGFTLVFC